MAAGASPHVYKAACPHYTLGGQGNWVEEAVGQLVLTAMKNYYTLSHQVILRLHLICLCRPCRDSALSPCVCRILLSTTAPFLAYFPHALLCSSPFHFWPFGLYSDLSFPTQLTVRPGSSTNCPVLYRLLYLTCLTHTKLTYIASIRL